MRTLITSMLSNNPYERPTCAQILAGSYSWSITATDIIYYGFNNEDIMKEHPDQFFRYYLQQRILSFNRLNKRFKVLENIGEGGIGRVFKVQDEFNQKVFTVKKLPYGKLTCLFL